MSQHLRLISSAIVLASFGCTYVDPGTPDAGPAGVAFAMRGGGGGTATVAVAPGILVGTLRGPAAGLVANNAGNLISNNAANLVANNAANLVANNSAGIAAGRGLVSQDGGTYQVLDVASLTTPVAGVAVTLVDDLGQPVSSGSVVTDARGNYRFEGVTTTRPVVFVKASYQQEGHTLDLSATAAPPRHGEAVTVPVDPATTLVAKKVTTLLASHAVTVDALQPEAIGKMVEAVAPLMTAETVVAATLLSADRAAATFDTLVKRNPGLQMQEEKLADDGSSPSAPRDLPPTGQAGLSVSTVAGELQGYADATGAAAQFNGPWDVAADTAGALYVSDYGNHCIRRVEIGTGQVTTLAGTVEAGFADGSGVDARFRNPRGLAYDPHEQALYVVDAGNARIRRVGLATTPATVTTIAGGEPGFADGPGASARFKDPRGVATDGQGHLYVADTGNMRVRRIDLADPAHPVTTVADLSSPDVVAGQPAGPYAVAVDTRQSPPLIYVADATSDAILTLGGDPRTQTTLVGGAQGLVDGAGIMARFRYPAGLAVGTRGLYVADSLNQMVRLVGDGAAVASVAGDGTAGSADGPGNTAELHNPMGLAVGADGRLYVADTGNHRIRAIGP